MRRRNTHEKTFPPYPHPTTFSTYGEFKTWWDSINPLDEYSFAIRSESYWLRESTPEIIERLEYNYNLYRAYIQHGKRFPSEIHDARMEEFHRLRTLRDLP